jgi:CRP-like cAMP-binding protein
MVGFSAETSRRIASRIIHTNTKQKAERAMQTGFVSNKFVNRLTSIAELTADDVELLSKMPFTIAYFDSHEDVRQKGDCPSSCCLLLQGYLCWVDGEIGDRQITSIHVPGDIVDFYTTVSPVVSTNLRASTATVVGFVPHSYFRDISTCSPTLNHALLLLHVIEAARSQNWIVNLGSRSSLARVAHLVCEIAVRLRAVGEGKDFCFPSPFTQSDLAAACAISPVHANRTVQELRRRNVLQWHSKMISIKDWAALIRLAGFKADYLGLRDPHANMREAPSWDKKRIERSQSAGLQG